MDEDVAIARTGGVRDAAVGVWAGVGDKGALAPVEAECDGTGLLEAVFLLAGSALAAEGFTAGSLAVC